MPHSAIQPCLEDIYGQRKLARQCSPGFSPGLARFHRRHDTRFHSRLSQLSLAAAAAATKDYTCTPTSQASSSRSENFVLHAAVRASCATALRQWRVSEGFIWPPIPSPSLSPVLPEASCSNILMGLKLRMSLRRLVPARGIRTGYRIEELQQNRTFLETAMRVGSWFI